MSVNATGFISPGSTWSTHDQKQGTRGEMVMRFSGTNESDFIKLRSHETKTSSSVVERAEMDRYRASSVDTSRRTCAGHEAVEASPLSRGIATGWRASTVCGCGSERRVASDIGIRCGGESFAILGSMDWLDQRATTTTPGLGGQQCALSDSAWVRRAEHGYPGAETGVGALVG